MSVYYNERDPEKEHILRAMMADGWIAPGEVDERDIRDVAPDELSGFAQCHFFAGIGGWSYALRRAGVPDDFPVWTGSAPCQPFSAAGAGKGIADDRHLWPHWFWLIAQQRPYAVLGEQVSSSDGLAWLSTLSADMEGAGYAGGALDLCSASVGAPNIRQRLYMCWLADAVRNGAEHRTREGLGTQAAVDEGDGDPPRERLQPRIEGQSRGVEHGIRSGLEGQARHGDERGQPGEPEGGECLPRMGCEVGAMAGRPVRHPLLDRPRTPFWSEVDWLLCRDPDGPRLRPARSGAFVLAARHPGRNALLRGYGDAINLEVATAFVEAVKPELMGEAP